MRHAILTSISSILLVIALVFLVLGTVSTPVASSLNLAAVSTYTFGIFGYCDGSECSSATYPVAFGTHDAGADWFLAEATRNTLSKTFVVAPIAAGMALFAFVFTFLSLFVRASALKILSLVFSVIAFVASALIAVMVVLVFFPHVAWLGWLLIAAAACCLVALPLLFFSITVSEDSEEESDSDAVQELKFGDISKMDSHTVYSVSGSAQDIKPQPGGFRVNQAPSNTSFDYRGASANTFPSQQANSYPKDQADTSNNSLLESSPKVANDVTTPMPRPYVANMGSRTGSGSVLSAQTAYNGLNIQNGPSTPIARNRQFAPNYVPSEGIAGVVGIGNVGPPGKAPYPLKNRASSIYNSRNYGVFDHHPTVEGHQPFTELQDTDVNVDRNSYNSDLRMSSDGESDFTSVSQRPPNETYMSPRGQHSPPRVQNPVYTANMPYQSPGSPMPPVQRPQGQFAGPSMQSYVGGPGWNQPQPPQQPQYSPQQQPQHPPQHIPQHPPQHMRPMNRPSVSDNALNNNPDFAIGAQGRRKQRGRGGFSGPRPNGGPPGGFARPGARDGPYGNI